MSDVGQRLLEERKRLGYDQTDFGVIGGVNRVTQGRYERCDRSPSVDYLVAIEKIGVDVSYLVTGERRYDLELKSLSSTERAKAVLIRVTEVQEDLQIEFTKEQIQMLMGYTYEHCPTREGLKLFVEAAFQLLGKQALLQNNEPPTM